MTKRIRSQTSLVIGKKQFAAGLQSVCRITKLRNLMRTKKIVRLLEAHNGLTGLIVEKTKVSRNGRQVEFDGIWEGSLADSLSKAKPDTSVVDMTSRLLVINEILDVTTKPIVVDADNGGLIEHFGFTVRTLERLGISAVAIEDKINLKRNSLFKNNVDQEQDTIENFCKKIHTGKKSQTTESFMIIARIESLILGKGMPDALTRAEAYIKAGADGILIHSKEKAATEILEFCREYKKITQTIPLTVIPTTYNAITESELIKVGVKMVIYANHLIRSAYPAMTRVAETILQNGRSLEADDLCIPVSKIINLIPFSESD